MNLIYLFLKVSLCFVLIYETTGVLTSTNENVGRSTKNVTTYQLLAERYGFIKDFFQIVYKKHYNETHLIDEESNKIEFLTNETLGNVYIECVLRLSLPCLQKKLITFLYNLDKMKNIRLVGKSVLVVRKQTNLSNMTRLDKVIERIDQNHLNYVIDNLIDKFFDNHILRVNVSNYFDKLNNTGPETYLDVNFGTESSSASLAEGRRKNPHGGKTNGLKKAMMLMGLMACMKLSMVVPLILGMVGMKVMQVVMFVTVSIGMILFSKFGGFGLFGNPFGPPPPFGNPFANPYGGLPFGNPFANPFAPPYGAPFGHPYGHPPPIIHHDPHYHPSGHGAYWDRSIQDSPSSSASHSYGNESPSSFSSYSTHS